MRIVKAYVYEGPLYEEAGEDGPRAVFDYFVGVRVLDGRSMTHKATFSPYEEHRAKTLVDMVEREGVIDLEHWTEANPWDRVQAEVAEANRLVEMGASEEDLERLNLA